MTKDELFNYLKDSDIIKTPSIIEAFRVIDRADFVAKEYLDEPYGDYPLPIGHGATISQPSTVALMLELLQPRGGDKVLDVGSGSGWTTALLAHIVGPEGEIIGVELIPELVLYGIENLKKYNFANAKIIQAQKEVFGFPDKAPFDKILVSAAAESLPQTLVGQLKIGGRMVIPIESSVWRIDKKSEKEIDKKEFRGFAFVPLK